MPHQILIVDDEREAREELVQYLSDKGYDCREASDVETALKIMHRHPELAIVITDIKMPGQEGLELVNNVNSEIDRDVEFIIVTGYGDTLEEIRSFRLGVREFLNKPIDLKRLLHVVQQADELLYHGQSEKFFRESIAAEIDAKTVELRTLVVDYEVAFEQALDALAVTAEYKCRGTTDHVKRMAAYARLMAAELGWSESRQKVIELAAPLHDVGKSGIPDAVLLKPGELTPDEFVIMQQHTEIGHGFLSRSDHPVMRSAASIALLHHERWDGTGYLRGLEGSEIPIEARIIAFGDIYDALRSKRQHKPAYSHEKALSIILEGDGRTLPEHFDPTLLEMFRARSDEFARIFASLPNRSENSSPGLDSVEN